MMSLYADCNYANIHHHHHFSGSANCEEEPDRTSRFWDELSHVGLPQHLNVQSLFESGKSIDSTLV